MQHQSLPPPLKGIVPPLKVNKAGALSGPSFVFPPQIKCCAAPAAAQEAFLLFFSLCQRLAMADLGVCMDAPVSHLSSPSPHQ